MKDTTVIKNMLLHHIDENADEIIDLCSNVIKIPSDNPPGNTTELAEFLEKYLTDSKIIIKKYEPLNGSPNLVATIKGSKTGPHIILLAHLDQFPAEVGEKWSKNPYSGEVSEGKIWGRGACDMKGGLAALTYCFHMINKLDIDFPGKISLCLVSDEETAGPWGAGWIVNNVPDIIGDASLNAEPSRLAISLGQKGWYPIRLKTLGVSAHGSRGRLAGENAILKMMKIVPVLLNFENIEGRFNEEVDLLIKETVKNRPDIENLEKSLRHVSVNIAVIKGGSKHNIVPATCEMEVDMRLPFGLKLDFFTNKIEKELRKVVPDIIIDYIYEQTALSEGSYTPVEEKIVKIMMKNIINITKEEPKIRMSSACNDSRFFTQKGVPSINYGPIGGGMAKADEYVTINSLITTVKVNSATIIDFLYSE